VTELKEAFSIAGVPGQLFCLSDLAHPGESLEYSRRVHRNSLDRDAGQFSLTEGAIRRMAADLFESHPTPLRLSAWFADFPADLQKVCAAEFSSGYYESIELR
jgi:hypothetical protein